MLSMPGARRGHDTLGRTHPYDGLAPETSPVLQPPDAAAGPVADGTARADGQVPLQPLVGHGHLQRGTVSSGMAPLQPPRRRNGDTAQPPSPGTVEEVGRGQWPLAGGSPGTPPARPRPCLPGLLQPPAHGAGQGCPQQTLGSGPTWKATGDPDAGGLRRDPQAVSPQRQAQRPHSAGQSWVPAWSPAPGLGTARLCGWLCPARVPHGVPPAYPILILDDFCADGGQGRPLAVVGGSDSAALMCLELTDCTGGSRRGAGTVPKGPAALGHQPLHGW